MSQPIRTPRRHGRVLSTALAAVMLAACSDSTDNLLPPTPPAAASLQLVSRTTPPGLLGAVLPDSVVVRALDAQGRPMASVPISFGTTGGGSQALPVTTVTDAEGYAKAVWQLAPSGEQQRLTVGANGAQPVHLTAR
ncbi:MAG TPA: hypothetical protein VLK84_15530, partial [Longimicrobium sp.]|nr:hypothetical protein [Longimicrobium sp.]